jgi:hypothetical protein
MNEQECLEKMVPPSQIRPGVWHGGVLQIWITRACDKACFGCTQASNLGGKPVFMTPEQFAVAIDSLKDYFGVVGVFGGNPALNPHFAEICEVFRNSAIPFSRRGLWCNNPMGKGSHMRGTFNPAVSNLNVHLDRAAFDEFRRDWPEAMPFGLEKDSRHSPVHGSMIDLGVPEAERWERISQCDINQRWSAMIGVFRGEVRGWFCEVAGAQAMLFQGDPNCLDTGIHIGRPTDSDGYPRKSWWQLPMGGFRDQVRQHCHNCLVPMKGHGELACSVDGKEQTTASYAGVFKPKRRERTVEIVQLATDLGKPLERTTDYIQNSAK